MTNTNNIIFILSTVFAAIIIFQLATNIKLKKDNKSYRNIIQYAGNAILFIDTIDGKIRYANYSAVQMLGYSLQELLNKTMFDICSKDEQNRCSDIMTEICEQKELKYTDLPFINASGKKIEAECDARIEYIEGAPLIVILVTNKDKGAVTA